MSDYPFAGIIKGKIVDRLKYDFYFSDDRIKELFTQNTKTINGESIFGSGNIVVSNTNDPSSSAKLRDIYFYGNYGEEGYIGASATSGLELGTSVLNINTNTFNLGAAGDSVISGNEGCIGFTSKELKWAEKEVVQSISVGFDSSDYTYSGWDGKYFKWTNPSGEVCYTTHRNPELNNEVYVWGENGYTLCKYGVDKCLTQQYKEYLFSDVLAKTEKIFTKTSQLENDADFVSKSYVDKQDATKFDDVEYNETTQTIDFKVGGVIKTSIDAKKFIKDGMVNTVQVVDSNLVISFNTDSGKDSIKIPLNKIFDASNYYTTSQVDSKLKKYALISDVENSLASKADISTLKDVAKTGDYNDLINKPISLRNPEALTWTVGVDGTEESYNGNNKASFVIPSKVSDLSDWNLYAKLSELDKYAKSGEIPTSLSQLTNDVGYTTTSEMNKKLADYVLTEDMEGRLSLKTDDSSLAAVAKSGDYNDLANIPTSLKNTSTLYWKTGSGTTGGSYDGGDEATIIIPSKVSELTDGSQYAKTEYVDEQLKQKANITSIPSKLSQLDNDGYFINKIETEGSGNAITSVSQNTNIITFAKETTFSIDGHTHDFNELTNTPSALRNPETLSWSTGSGASKGSYDGSKGVSFVIPSKVTDLEDGGEYAKNEDVPTNLSDLVNDLASLSWSSGTGEDYTTGSYNGREEASFTIPKYVTDLKDSDGYATKQYVEELRAQGFFKDGMVEDAKVVGTDLVISFNSDAGKTDIKIPISDIFNASNYYTKTETDEHIASKTNKPLSWSTGTNGTTTTYDGSEEISFVIPDIKEYVDGGNLATLSWSSGTGKDLMSGSYNGSGAASFTIPAYVTDLKDGGNYVTKELLGIYAKSDDVPTKTSQLINDTGFFSSLTINTTGSGNALTSVSCVGSVINFTKEYSFALADHTHTVDSSLSSTSTNPVQNKVINIALEDINTTIEDNIIYWE